jgi:hypothetical protein
VREKQALAIRTSREKKNSALKAEPKPELNKENHKKESQFDIVESVRLEHS